MRFPQDAVRTSEKELLKNFDVRPSRTEPTVIDGEITGKRAVRAYAGFTYIFGYNSLGTVRARKRGKSIHKLCIANFWHSTRTHAMDATTFP